MGSRSHEILIEFLHLELGIECLKKNYSDFMEEMPNRNSMVLDDYLRNVVISE